MKSLTAQSIVLHDCFLPCCHRRYAQIKVSWLLVCSSAYWKPFFGSALRLLYPVCTVARLIYPPVRDSQWSSILFRLAKFRWCMPNRRLLIVSCCCSPACHNYYRFVFRPTFTEGSYPLSLALGQFLFYRRVRTVTRHPGFIKAQPINGAIGFCRNGAKILLLFVPIMVGRGGVEPPFSVFQTGAPTVYATCPYRKTEEYRKISKCYHIVRPVSAYNLYSRIYSDCSSSVFFMAAGVGFEPTGQLITDTEVFKTTPLCPLRYPAR